MIIHQTEITDSARALDRRNKQIESQIQTYQTHLSNSQEDVVAVEKPKRKEK